MHIKIFAYPFTRCLFAAAVFLTAPALWSDDRIILRLHVREGYAPESSCRHFEELMRTKYGRPISLQVTLSAGADDFYNSIRFKEADLVTLPHHQFRDEQFNYISNGLLLPLNTENISHYTTLLPDLSGAESFWTHDGLYGVPVSQEIYAFMFNSSKVNRWPQSWNILWEPQYQEDYALGANEYFYNICTTALAMGYPKESLTRFDKLNTAEFRKRLRELTEHAAGFWEEQEETPRQFGRSLSTGWGGNLKELKRQGEKWQVAMPREGSIRRVTCYAVTWALADKPFHKKIAEEWINYLLSPEFQVNQIVREMSRQPVTATAVNEMKLLSKHKSLTHTAEYYKENCILLPTCSRRDRNGFKLLWSEAMKDLKPAEPCEP